MYEFIMSFIGIFFSFSFNKLELFNVTSTYYMEMKLHIYMGLVTCLNHYYTHTFCCFNILNCFSFIFCFH